MTKPAEDDGIVFFSIAILAFFMWCLIRSDAAPRWMEAPLTVSGQYLDIASANGSALFRICATSVVVLANGLRPWAPLLAALCLPIGLYPRTSARYGRLTDWSSDALVASSVLMGLAGFGTLLAAPLAWPRLLQVSVLIIAASNVLAAAACALLASQRGKERRVLEHGPAFVSPESDGPSILVGSIDADILPGHARWLAREKGEVRIPFNRLSRGITILGEKGSGKSRLLFAIHDAIRAQYPNVPILIHDPKGEWYRTYHKASTDLYYAPHFKDSRTWNVWKDFHDIPEIRHALLTAAVHAHPGSESFWMDQAVDMLQSAASHEEFTDAVAYFASIPRSRPDDRFLLSVFGSARLGFLEIAKAQLMGGTSPSLSIDEFLKFPGRILLLNDPSCADQQSGVFSLFLTAFLLRVLSMPDVPAGTLRAVAIIDEALTFHLPADVDRRIYSLCRSKGLCIIAGAQRLPDRNNGERGEWQNAEYTFAMKVIHQETQFALSKRAGTLLFRQKKESKSTHLNGSSTSESEQDSRQDAIPPEHFGRLDPRQFVLFHDRGIVTGETVDVRHEQRETALPAFDALNEVTEISRQMMLGGQQ